MIRNALIAGAAILAAATASAQTTNNPFPQPIEATDDVITVNFEEFASLPPIGGVPARMMHLVDEPGSERIFVNDMRGPIYSVSYGGESVVEYIDVNEWGVDVEASSRETGMQSFAFHPQFNQPGTDGYGKFYTWTDVTDTGPAADYTPSGDGDSHDTVVHEWTAGDPQADAYDGAEPRELLRVQQPFGNHNGGFMGFNPLAAPGDDDFGMLYVVIADGGAGGDPYDMAEDLDSAFGKLFRIDPLGDNGPNGAYGIPADNPFIDDDSALDEIYAYGIRNGQHMAWDPDTGRMYLSEIGQNIVEEVSPVSAGADLGWNAWEGSFPFNGGMISASNRRGDPDVTYPIAEWDHTDPILQARSATSGLVVYRDGDIPALEDLILFGDLVSGEIFYVSADNPPDGGQDPIRRVLLNDDGQTRTLLEVIQAKNREQGRPPAQRADLRFDAGPGGEVYLLNKADGTIRMLVP